MANYNLTTQEISSSFQQLMQHDGDTNQVYDGTGSLITNLDVTSSQALTASYAENVVDPTWDNIQDKPSGIISSSEQLSLSGSDIYYNNQPTSLTSSNVQDAITELDMTKAPISALSSNLIVYPTTATSSIAGYFTLVSSPDEEGYNTTAANVPTGTISGSNQFIAALATTGSLFQGNPGVINITTFGNVRRTGGGSNSSADFYFEVYKRSGSVETLIATSNNTTEVNAETYEQFFATALLNNGNFTEDDVIVTKYYGSLINVAGADPSFDFQFGGEEPIRTLIPVPASVITDPTLTLRVNNLEIFSASQEELNTTFATTGSNTFDGDQVISGSLSVQNGNINYSFTTSSIKMFSSDNPLVLPPLEIIPTNGYIASSIKNVGSMEGIGTIGATQVSASLGKLQFNSSTTKLLNTYGLSGAEIEIGFDPSGSFPIYNVFEATIGGTTTIAGDTIQLIGSSSANTILDVTGQITSDTFGKTDGTSTYTGSFSGNLSSSGEFRTETLYTNNIAAIPAGGSSLEIDLGSGRLYTNTNGIIDISGYLNVTQSDESSIGVINFKYPFTGISGSEGNISQRFYKDGNASVYQQIATGVDVVEFVAVSTDLRFRTENVGGVEFQVPNGGINFVSSGTPTSNQIIKKSSDALGGNGQKDSIVIGPYTGSNGTVYQYNTWGIQNYPGSGYNNAFAISKYDSSFQKVSEFQVGEGKVEMTLGVGNDYNYDKILLNDNGNGTSTAVIAADNISLQAQNGVESTNTTLGVTAPDKQGLIATDGASPRLEVRSQNQAGADNVNVKVTGNTQMAGDLFLNGNIEMVDPGQIIIVPDGAVEAGELITPLLLVDSLEPNTGDTISITTDKLYTNIGGATSGGTKPYEIKYTNPANASQLNLITIGQSFGDANKSELTLDGQNVFIAQNGENVVVGNETTTQGISFGVSGSAGGAWNFVAESAGPGSGAGIEHNIKTKFTDTLNLNPMDPLPTTNLSMGDMAVSSSAELYFYDGTNWRQVSLV